jgi:branched-chain amino acid transport system ATP-binding protein
MNALLEVRGLTAGYGKTVAIRNVDLTVNEGEIVCILGPNGAGKSTTLLALAGVLPRMAGDITALGSTVIAGRPHLAARRGIALVPEQRALFTQLTVRENLALGARRGGASQDQVLSYFPELSPKLNTKAGLMSGGEQQMLAIGRALGGGPKLLLIDEMSLGLAPVIVKRLLDFLKVVTTTLGGSVLLVEQQVVHALSVSDRAYVLSHGDMVLTGSAADLLKDRSEIDKSYFGTADNAGKAEL